MSTLTDTADRPLTPALKRGVRRRCPRCGEGALFDGYVAVKPACEVCGQAFDGHQSDDLPPWGTIMITGHLLAPMILFVELELSPPLWVSYTLWPLLVLALCFVLLPRVKGAVLAFQWAKRLHGFAAPSPMRDPAP